MIPFWTPWERAGYIAVVVITAAAWVAWIVLLVAGVC